MVWNGIKNIRWTVKRVTLQWNTYVCCQENTHVSSFRVQVGTIRPSGIASGGVEEALRPNYRFYMGGNFGSAAYFSSFVIFFFSPCFLFSFFSVEERRLETWKVLHFSLSVKLIHSACCFFPLSLPSVSYLFLYNF